ncbi:MAG: hypothetical protein NTV54_08940 [Ignavibacteriales bacterium]|nr:hypothetical protein [Ignavibacteriales bacterium]
MWTAAILAAFVCIWIVFEYRLRKPDQLVLRETAKGLTIRTGRFYPRHFSLAMSRTTHSFAVTVDASAKGNLDVRVKIAVSVTASTDNIFALMRVGGWNSGAVEKAAKELESIFIGTVKGYTEHLDIESISSAQIAQHLMQSAKNVRETLGLEILSLSILSSEPVNIQISEALRQRESARILEQTEMLNQQARVATARARAAADEEIALVEHQREVKQIELKTASFAKESHLQSLRVEEEIKHTKLRLEMEKKELDLLKGSPELLMLTPQAARLAEASQGLKNARTVVSVGSKEIAQGVELFGIFQKVFEQAVTTYKQKSKDK